MALPPPPAGRNHGRCSPYRSRRGENDGWQGAKAQGDAHGQVPPRAAIRGEIEGCPFSIDFRLYEAWNKAGLILDVAPGEPEEFSLGPGGGMHFVVRSEACALPDKLPL